MRQVQNQRNICFYFQVHQPLRLQSYRFFDIGAKDYYYDDYTNETILNKVLTKCYLPTNALLLKLIKQYKGEFKVSFSISGVALDQFRLYAPEVIDSFKALVDTGCVELLGETYAHSLVSLRDKDEFKKQVQQHERSMQTLFGYQPKVFRNTELIYSDEIGEMVYNMGYKGMITEGANQILDWKSPNYLYQNAKQPELKILLKNYTLSDDIAFRFGDQSWSEYPLTADKYANWLNNIEDDGEVVNLFMDYETFGEHQWKETGIFQFLEELPEQVLQHSNLAFARPSEVFNQYHPVDAIHVHEPISWADEARDLSAWLGNEMQQEAFNKLYDHLPKIKRCMDKKLLMDWQYLQVSDHFYYMSTKFFADGDVHAYFNPYETPYAAFINYMNVLSDFEIRLEEAVPDEDATHDSQLFIELMQEKDERIKQLEAQLKATKKRKRRSYATSDLALVN